MRKNAAHFSALSFPKQANFTIFHLSSNQKNNVMTMIGQHLSALWPAETLF
jgi:hypothetical protein